MVSNRYTIQWNWLLHQRNLLDKFGCVDASNGHNCFSGQRACVFDGDVDPRSLTTESDDDTKLLRTESETEVKVLITEAEL